MLNLLLFGPPGSGKGTQSQKIIEKYQLFHFSTGDVLRRHRKEGTELGKQAQEYITAGKLVPDSLIIDLVKTTLRENTQVKGYIFDGFPRTVAQAQALDELMKEQNSAISGMISLLVPDDELRARLKKRAIEENRPDDQDEKVINTRIETYKNETLPVADYYKAQGKLYELNGVGDIEAIFQSICQVIDSMPQ
ncbi:MAG: adenylate kinase [Microscillaceae bacterium]|nr:adenylate kinase [Microscillaceae bacterium]MDW8461158.1 adenylate kinase [Cytophagales bacterium]